MEVEKRHEYEEPTLLDVLKETALLPTRLLLSKPALKTYLSTILLFVTAIVFYAVAATTYVYFYYNYIPNLSFSVPIHLQYEVPQDRNRPASLGTYGISALTTPSSIVGSPLVSQQNYDISASLTLPRTTSNVNAGNFMLVLTLWAPTTKTVMPPYPSFEDVEEGYTRIARSSRPASLTYISPLLERVQKAAALPLYLTGWKQELETLHVPLMERVAFEKDWRRIPRALALNVQSSTRLHIYHCEVHIKARLSGIRWLMYNYRVASFLLFTSIFWSVEMGTALGVFLIASLLLPSSTSKSRSQQSIEQGSGAAQQRIKREGGVADEDDDIDNLSDTSRNFPTFSRQPPLHYSSGRDTRVKVEDADEQEVGAGAGQTAEADVSATDTDEDADFVLQEPESVWQREREFRDSGLGTSFESGSGSGSAARRRGSTGRGGSAGSVGK